MSRRLEAIAGACREANARYAEQAARAEATRPPDWAEWSEAFKAGGPDDDHAAHIRSGFWGFLSHGVRDERGREVGTFWRVSIGWTGGFAAPVGRWLAECTGGRDGGRFGASRANVPCASLPEAFAMIMTKASVSRRRSLRKWS